MLGCKLKSLFTLEVFFVLCKWQCIWSATIHCDIVIFLVCRFNLLRQCVVIRVAATRQIETGGRGMVIRWSQLIGRIRRITGKVVSRRAKVTLRCIVVFAALCLLIASPAFAGAGDTPPAAQPAPASDADARAKADAEVKADAEAAKSEVALGKNALYEKSLAALTMLLVLAVLLENAFSVIFNWRVFLTYFSLRGVKTIVMVTVSLI